MEVWEHDGRRFEIEVASDLDRDGVALELTALDDSPGAGHVLEAFWHDTGSGVDLVIHRPTTLPLAVVERFVSEARKRLPPVGR